jgi:hypothetical protein
MGHKEVGRFMREAVGRLHEHATSKARDFLELGGFFSRGGLEA